MQTFTRVLSIALVSLATLMGCGGGGGGYSAPPPAQPPPPGAPQSPSGVWDGQALTQGAPDVSTSFEFTATGGFSVGTAPFTATFSSGNAETRGIPSFYIAGLNAWHILVGTSATVSFETPSGTLSFWVRTENATDVSDIQILDETSALIMAVTPTNAYQRIVVTRATGETSIGSMVVTSTSGGDVVIDDLTFGFPSTTDDIDCVVAETLGFVCIVTDATTGDFLAGVQGTVQASGSEVTEEETLYTPRGTTVTTVTGSGTLYAAPGTTLADGSTVANLAVSAGTISEGNSLDLTIDAAGVSISVSTRFDTASDRGSDLATVAGVYSTFDIFGDPASFSVDANGIITSQSNSGCVGNGQISIIDANFDAYGVTLDMTSCGALDGMYDGLGSTRDANAIDDVFSFGVFTSQAVIVGEPTK